LRLPRVDEATIDPRKLCDYALNPEHPTGKHKARVFKAALDFDLDSWEELRDQILQRLDAALVTAVRQHRDGLEYTVAVSVDGRNGKTAVVITGWMYDGDRPPRLTTLYVERP
jgi:Domain of unknown function (DUF6883)